MAVIALPIALALSAATGAAVSVGAVTTGLYLIGAIGLGIASSALQRSLKPDMPGDVGAAGLSTLNAPDVKASVRQATPFQRINYGQQRFGGAFAFYKAKPGYLYVQHMYSRRKLSSILGLNINGNKLALPSSAFGQILRPLAIDGQPNYPNRLRVCFQDGTLNQPTNPLLADAFDLPAGWRLPGIANAVYEFQYGSDYDEFVALWGNVQIPDVEPEAECAPIFDPRDPTQFLPADPDDIEEWFAAQETWKYSANAALIAADHLWQKDGLNAGPTSIDWGKIAEAADRADEAVATRDTADTGVYERRYSAGGVVTLDQTSAEVFDGILTASRATMIQGNKGLVWVSHDAPSRSVFTITDDMVIGAVTFRGFKGRHDLANVTQMRFVSPDRKYQLSDGPPLIRADLIAEDGQELPLSVTLPFTPSSSTAQRIAKADLSEARIEESWNGVIDLRGLGIREDDVILIASKVCPHWNRLYKVDRYTVTLNLQGESGIGLALVGYDPTMVGDWDAATDDKAVDLTDTDDLLAA